MSAHNHYNTFAGRALERIPALSDGLIAIAMTLIVIEIHTPVREAIHSELELWHAMEHLIPELVTYLMSFLTLGIFWVGQQTVLSHLESTDRTQTWIHLTFLAMVALMPFSTKLLAEFITYRLALLEYWLNIVLLGLLLFISWSYAVRHGMLREGVLPETVHAVRNRVLRAQTLYAVGAALCVINTYCSIGFIVAVQLNYAIAPRIRWLQRLTG